MPFEGERPWRAQRRRKILDAAAVLFAETEYDAVQVDEIARRAAVGKPTLYRYFPSKEALYLEVFDAALHRLELRLEEIAASDERPRDRLALMLEALALALEQARTLRVLDEADPALAGRWRQLYRARRSAIVGALRSVIEAGLASGDFRAADPEVMPGILVGMIRGGLMSAPRVSCRRIAEAAIALALDGALTPAEAAVTPRTSIPAA